MCIIKWVGGGGGSRGWGAEVEVTKKWAWCTSVVMLYTRGWGGPPLEQSAETITVLGKCTNKHFMCVFVEKLRDS